jgi:peptidase A4-like protein
MLRGPRGPNHGIWAGPERGRRRSEGVPIRFRWWTVSTVVTLVSILVLNGASLSTAESSPRSMVLLLGSALITGDPAAIGASFAGYLLLNGQHGSVTAASESYLEPTATCASAESVNGSFPRGQNVYVGPILYDGAADFSQFTAVQLATEAVCPDSYQTPIYFASHLTVVVTPSDPSFDTSRAVIPNIPVEPGDLMQSVLTSSTGSVTIRLTDLTSGVAAKEVLRTPGFAPNGAGCIVESWGNLARFTTVDQGCRVEVNGSTRGIGNFPSSDLLLRFNQVNGNGQVQAFSSVLASDGETFSVGFLTAKPLQIFPEVLSSIESGFAGYALFNRTPGSVSAVSDSFAQPTASCFTDENATGHYPNDQNGMIGAAMYAGDQNFSSFRLYQVGTEVLCPIFEGNPVYLAFYAVATVSPTDPSGDVTFVSLPALVVQAGDQIGTTVLISPLGVTLIVDDQTRGEVLSIPVTDTSFAPNGAECILEPYGNLAEFASVTQTCRATVNGTTDGIGDFPSSNVLLRVNLINATGGVQVSTSTLSDDGAEFSTTWITSSPLEF